MKKSIYANKKAAAALAAIMLGVALVSYQGYQVVKPVASEASGIPPHWEHASIPFKLELMDVTDTSSRKTWASALTKSIGAWDAAGVVHYLVTPGVSQDKDPCALSFAGSATVTAPIFCSYSADNGILASAYYGWGFDSHIKGAKIAMNDYYLDNPNSLYGYSTSEWRNKFLCLDLGYILGLGFRNEPSDKSQSCMNGNYNFETVTHQQSPDQTDYLNLQDQYNHIDSPASVPAGTAATTDSEPLKQLGTLVRSVDNGNVRTELYEQDFGDGSVARAVVQRLLK